MKLAGNGSDILDKNDIFVLWGINDFGIEHEEEAVLKEPDKILKSENFDQDSELVCTMKDLEEIADFYNQIKRETWLEMECLPEEKSNI